MRKVIALFVIMVMIAVFTTGCKSTLAGTYYEDGNTSETLQFSKDGTFISHSSAGGTYNGNYTVNGDVVTMVVSGIPATAKIEEGSKKLTAFDGSIFIFK